MIPAYTRFGQPISDHVSGAAPDHAPETSVPEILPETLQVQKDVCLCISLIFKVDDGVVKRSTVRQKVNRNCEFTSVKLLHERIPGSFAHDNLME